MWPTQAGPLEQTHYERLYLSGDQHLQVTPGTMAVQSSYPARTGRSMFTYCFASDTQLTGYLKAHLWVEAKGQQRSGHLCAGGQA